MIRRSKIALVLAAVLVCAAGPVGAAGKAGTLRVCADPNNLPFSNAAGEGFENKLAEMVAAEFGWDVEYTWFAQRRGFIRNTLKAEKCDVVMGLPSRLELVATTEPYYRSTYVFVTRKDRHLDIHSIADDRLRKLRIGVHLIGDDGSNTPPAHALGEEGIVDNVTGYMIYGDYRQPAPPALLLSDVAQDKLDIAAVWGPLAGYFGPRLEPPLAMAPITETARFAPLAFDFDISMGVRHGDEALKRKLNRFIESHRPQIATLLASYGVPVVSRTGKEAGSKERR